MPILSILLLFVRRAYISINRMAQGFLAEAAVVFLRPMLSRACSAMACLTENGGFFAKEGI